MLELSTLKAKTVTVTDQAGNVLYTLPTTVGEPGQGLRLDAQMNLVWSDMTPPRYFFSHAYEELVHKNDKTYTLTTTVPSKFSSHIYDYDGEMIWGVQSGMLVENGPEIYFETGGTYTMEFDFATMTYSANLVTYTHTHTYGNNESGVLFTASNPTGGSVTLNVTQGATERMYDFLIVRDGSGNELYRNSGDHAGQEITSNDGTLTVEIISDSSVFVKSPLIFVITLG